VTIRSKRHLSGTFAWALSLAALIFVAGLVATFLQETPDRALATLAAIAFVAGASGVVLNWRLGRAHSHALRDPLTGLPNRVLLEDRIEQALRRSRRTDERFTLILVDLDGF
jgi:GGDEF domain-containing protein